MSRIIEPAAAALRASQQREIPIVITNRPSHQEERLILVNAAADISKTGTCAALGESSTGCPSPATASLRCLLDGFLRHLTEYRHCSPLTADAYEREAERFFRFLETQSSSKPADEITRGDVNRFLTSLHGLSPASIRRAIYALASFFRHLVDLEIVDRNPASDIEVPKLTRTIPRAPTAEQCGQLLQACESTTEECAISLMLLAGLRRCEVLGLQVGDVAADFSQLLIRGKGGKQRVVPVSLALHSTLRRYLKHRDTDGPSLIINTVGGPMGINTLYRLFRRVLARAGLIDAGITPHSLRHAFASHLVSAGVDVATISELLGHANIATTSIYLHSSDASKAQAVEKLSFVLTEDERSVTEAAEETEKHVCTSSDSF